MSAFENLKSPIFVALDLDDKTLIHKIFRETADLVGGFKIGPRVVFRFGTKIIEELSEKAPVFLDFKYYDIPSTMESAVRAGFGSGASFATVHSLAGSEALSRLAKTEKELNNQRPFSLLAVTLLTSYSPKTLPKSFGDLSIAQHVSELAKLTWESGIEGLVCSPHELIDIKTGIPGLKCVTPGIRMEFDSKDDQSRTATPREAIGAGATALVVGRSLLQAPNPRQYVQDLLASLK